MIPVQECPVCKGTEFQPFALDPWRPGRLHFAQARCRGCGLLAAQPQASPEEMEQYYCQHYYQELWPDPERSWISNTEGYEGNEWRLMQQLWRDWPPPPRGLVA